MSLVPLAYALKCHTFKIGEYLLEQGKFPESMMILASGSCKVSIERSIVRPVDPNPKVKGLISKQRGMSFGVKMEQRPLKKKGKKILFRKWEFENKRSFDFDLRLPPDKSKTAYNKQVTP